MRPGGIASFRHGSDPVGDVPSRIVAATPPGSADDAFDEADAAARGGVDNVTNRILQKHAALKRDRGGTSRVEKIRTDAVQAAKEPPPPRPDVVIAIIIGNGWIDPDKIEELREFFLRRGVTQVLRKRAKVSGLLVERGLLEPHHARELELTLLDQGIFARYRITRLLGQGLVGRTYVAVDLQAGIDVAYKVFRQPDPDRQQRFLDEFAALEKVRSRRIAQALACGVHDEVCFAATRLIVGERLADLIAQRRIRSEVHAARIALQIAEGLAYVHVTASLCHLALRPENVLVQDPDSPRMATVLTDFGVSEQIPPYRSIDRAWRAPEFESGAAGDFRSDIYTVGAIFYNMLGAIDDPDAPAPTEPPTEFDLSAFSPATRDIIYKAASPDPADRFGDYRSLIAKLSRLVRELGFIEPDDVPDIERPPGEGPGTMFIGRARMPGSSEIIRRDRVDKGDKDGFLG